MSRIPDRPGSVYFIGIAGIGMSALARYYLRTGAVVSGYDRDRSELARQLEQEGARIHYDENIGSIPKDVDLVIYTPAIPDTHAELQYLRSTDVPVIKRSEALGYLSRDKRCIAVAGTHGKTTTSAMITFILRLSGLDCTAILGGVVTDFSGNFVFGDSEWLITEADEYDRSFLQLSPEIAVVTSLDPDHLDIYGTYEEMKEAYTEFMLGVLPGGVLIVHEDVLSRLGEERSDRLVAGLLERNIPLIMYGEGENMFRCTNIRSDQSGMVFDFNYLLRQFTDVRLSMIGTHNVLNATAALAVAGILEKGTKYESVVTLQTAADALGSFSGISRRFEFRFRSDALVVIDDYAHHPGELEAVIDAAQRHFKGKRITGVFQPHLYSRTNDFYHEFAEALSCLEECVLVELYPARELPIEGVSSELIFDLVKSPVKKLTTKSALTDELRSIDPEVLLFMGAGDLDRMIDDIIDSLKSKRN